MLDHGVKISTAFIPGEPVALSLTEAIALHDALQTVSSVLDGLLSQPRFGRGVYNSPGLELDNLQTLVMERMEGLVALVNRAEPESAYAGSRKQEFLLRYLTTGSQIAVDVAMTALRDRGLDQI